MDGYDNAKAGKCPVMHGARPNAAPAGRAGERGPGRAERAAGGRTERAVAGRTGTRRRAASALSDRDTAPPPVVVQQPAPGCPAAADITRLAEALAR